MNASGRSSAEIDAADVVVIGDGVIGLSIALALGQAGASCALLGSVRPGAASGAAAGLLAPSIGTPPAAQAFFDRSLAMYDSYLGPLRAIDPELRLVRGLLDTSTGRFYEADGTIDAARLLAALRRAVAASPVRVFDDAVVRVGLGATPMVTAASGRQLRAGRIIVAAGAWTPFIEGLPRHLPVSPLKGQMLALSGSPLEHATLGAGVYLVPRERETVVGATAERAGFDTSVDPVAIDGLRRAAERVCPALAEAAVTRTWAGLRPATPDLLPIIGQDPDAPELVYACGHSKNGILLAPATAAAVVDLCGGRETPPDVAPFSVERFG